jgi:beta-galactosidase
VESTPRVIGGCIWEFKDQGLKKRFSGVKYYAYGGDFGEKYFDNFTIKGVVNADGKPKGAMYECKRVFQPIQVEWADSIKGFIKIINRSEVKNVNKYSAVLEIREDGNIILTKLVGGIDVAPASEVVFDISQWLSKINPGAEYHATIRFVLLRSELWATNGFEIASNQLKIPNDHKLPGKQNFTAPMAFKEDDSRIHLTGKNFTIAFSKLSGALSSYIQNGHEQVLTPLLPHFTRPQTDNDKRGWKTHRVLKQWYGIYSETG